MKDTTLGNGGQIARRNGVARRVAGLASDSIVISERTSGSPGGFGASKSFVVLAQVVGVAQPRLRYFMIVTTVTTSGRTVGVRKKGPGVA